MRAVCLEEEGQSEALVEDSLEAVVERQELVEDYLVVEEPLQLEGQALEDYLEEQELVVQLEQVVAYLVEEVLLTLLVEDSLEERKLQRRLGVDYFQLRRPLEVEVFLVEVEGPQHQAEDYLEVDLQVVDQVGYLVLQEQQQEQQEGYLEELIYLQLLLVGSLGRPLV